jgi:hypothetical protein
MNHYILRDLIDHQGLKYVDLGPLVDQIIPEFHFIMRYTNIKNVKTDLYFMLDCIFNSGHCAEYENDANYRKLRKNIKSVLYDEEDVEDVWGHYIFEDIHDLYQFSIDFEHIESNNEYECELMFKIEKLIIDYL